MQRFNWSMIAVLAAGALLAPPLAAQTAISTDGVIQSTSGGFQFPDGTVQTSAAAALGDCPTLDPSDEMIWVGGVCIDKYEASIWDAPVGGNQIIGGETDYCNPNGQDCTDIYARSVAGVEPARFVSWFQAQQALANSGKRLPTNAEWQMAVRDTPDGFPCNTDSTEPVETGSLLGCVSDFGAFDMVGNLWEWVADWVPLSTDCPGWDTFSDDWMCLSGASTAEGPGALTRGGYFDNGPGAGSFAVLVLLPSRQTTGIGFRGAR